MSLGQRLFHQMTVKDYVFTPDSGKRMPERDEESDTLFLARMDGRLDFAGKTVLDVGCGWGSLSARAARSGATRVVGVDLDAASPEERISERYPDVADRVSFVATKGQLAEIAGEEFDLVISKDSMEHFPQPEAFVPLMADLVKAGGELAVGFSPLWKSPNGGHIDFMTRVPWAHLVFSEKTIMAERRRFRPEEHAESFSEIKGGLNKMTFTRFSAMMADTGFEPIYFETNVSDNPAVKAMKAIAKVPPLREYFTTGIYSIWRTPGSQSS
jgi:2-polyprenyl-3-methyl-5-hydroxy-6-metoxy-1,4-benzoquinol methylase